MKALSGLLSSVLFAACAHAADLNVLIVGSTHDAGDSLADLGPVGQRQALDLDGRFVAGLHQNEQAATGLLGNLDKRSNCVEAEVGIDRDRVGSGHGYLRCGVDRTELSKGVLRG